MIAGGAHQAGLSYDYGGIYRIDCGAVGTCYRTEIYRYDDDVNFVDEEQSITRPAIDCVEPVTTTTNERTDGSHASRVGAYMRTAEAVAVGECEQAFASVILRVAAAAAATHSVLPTHRLTYSDMILLHLCTAHINITIVCVRRYARGRGATAG